MTPNGLAHLSSPPGRCTFPTPSPVPPHRTPSSLSPCRQPPLPLSCPYISCLSPPRLLPSLSLTSSPQLQGGTLSTCLQSRPSQPSRRSKSPLSHPPRPSPTAPSVRAGGAGRGRFGQVGTGNLSLPIAERQLQGRPGCAWLLTAWPKHVPTCNHACRGLGLPRSRGGQLQALRVPHFPTPSPAAAARGELGHATPQPCAEL